MGITCTPMGIYSQRFYAAMTLLSYQYYTCQMPTMPIVPSLPKLNQNANVFSIVIINDQDFCYQEHIIIITVSLIIYGTTLALTGREWGGWEQPTRESHGNGNKVQNIGNGDGREWELNRWECEGMGMLKAIPAHLQFILHIGLYNITVSSYCVLPYEKLLTAHDRQC